MLQGHAGVGDQARELRRRMSLPEVVLWRELRKKPADLKFRRQHPSGPFVADFYCHEARLVIEVDSFAHETGDRPQRDRVRDSWFAERNIATLRIAAKDVLSDLAAVVQHISTTARARINPPLQGEVAARSADGGASPFPDSVTPLRLALAGNPPPLAGED